MERGGLYVHLAFCPYICPYCDFAKWAYEGAAARRYLAALEREAERAPAFAAATIFFGGGTPNTYAPAQIAALVERLRARFAVPEGAEISVECNPDRDLCEGFARYREAGISRLSFGVQSFDEGELKALGRRHSPADVDDAFTRARAAGFENLSLDLMFGVPGQTRASWERTLERALALEPAHLSTYGLTIEPDTPYARWHARAPQQFPGNDLEAELYGIAIDRLTAAGFEHYEISNFARPGFRCRHNANYWRNGPYLGLGAGAASYLSGVRSTHTRDLDAYLDALEKGLEIPGNAERLAGAARAGEAAMLALRTAEGVEATSFAERYGIDFFTHYNEVLEEMRDAGLIETTASHVRLTRQGRFLANDVCAAFVTAP